jgi:MFS family permease
VLIIVGFSAAVVGAYGPMLSPGFVVIAADLGISINTLSQSTAWLILMIGLSLFFFNPMAKKVGRRPVYIISSIILLSCSIWGALAKDYNSFLGSRLWGGLGMAPYEVLVQCTIADLYFVHERATRIAIWNMFLLCGISGGSLVAGYIIQVSQYLQQRRLMGLIKETGPRMAMDFHLVCDFVRGAAPSGLLLCARDSL